MGNELLEDIEIWKPILINGVPTYYSISSHGRIKSNYKEVDKVRPASNNGHGYLSLMLSLNGKKYPRKVHRLVALAFIPNPNNLPEVNHDDLNKQNNHVSNLLWSSKPDNAKHAGVSGRLSRGGRKLPSKPIGKYFAGILLKSYPSLGQVKKDGYPRVSVTRAVYSGKNYQGFFWKSL